MSNSCLDDKRDLFLEQKLGVKHSLGDKRELGTNQELRKEIINKTIKNDLKNMKQINNFSNRTTEIKSKIN